MASYSCRRYLAYNLTPVAGVAAHISRNDHPADVYVTSSIMAPLPLSGAVEFPVTVFGCFLVCHNRGRFLFKYQDSEALLAAQPDPVNDLVEAWNRELMSCARDSYVEMILEIQKLRRDPLSSAVKSNAGRALSLSLKAYGVRIYSFWPRSSKQNLICQTGNSKYSDSTEILKADWECLVEQVIKPLYAHVINLPVWQLYSGNLVKAEEGMFLSQPGNGVGCNLVPATVCSFVKEHYPVFSVPWELVTEIQAVGAKVQEIKPKMVRDLLRVSSTSIVLRSVDTYVDVLEYCLSDIQLPGSSNFNGDDASTSSINSTIHRASSVSVPYERGFPGLSAESATSSGDALEMITSLRKAIFDFGRGVVEDIGRTGGPSVQRNIIGVSSNGSSGREDQKLLLIAAEIKGLPCPTATNHLTKLGVTELWYGDDEQQALMIPLVAKFIHPKILGRSILADIFSNPALQTMLKLQNFSLRLLACHMRLLFHANWVSHVMASNMAPWFSWEKKSSSGGEGGPSPEWIRLFWKSFSWPPEDLSLFSEWPLIPAFLGRPILCRVRERHLIFIPPPFTDPTSAEVVSEVVLTGRDPAVLPRSLTSESRLLKSYVLAFEGVRTKYPWLFPLLNHCNIPIYDLSLMDCAAASNCLPSPTQSLGQVIASKLVAAKHAGYLAEVTSLSTSDRDELFTLFANDFFSHSSNYGIEELKVLRFLPIYKTVVGSYTRLDREDQCMISSNSFLKPYDERCLSYSSDSIGCSLLRALGISELHDQQILIRFGVLGFEGKPRSEQEDVLIYLYTNWQDLQADSSLVEALTETKFVRNADEFSTDLFRPKDLFDPTDAILTSVFSGERKKFPGERFSAAGWLQILRKIGLQTATEADVILECAKRVEFLGCEFLKTRNLDNFELDVTNSQNEVSLEIWSLSVSVVEAILTNFALFYGNNFCNVLGKIACIPAELGLPNFGSKKSCKRVLTSYSEAILSKDWPLAWSCMPILSKHAVVPPEYSWGALHLRSPPAFSTVLKHLQVICSIIPYYVQQRLLFEINILLIEMCPRSLEATVVKTHLLTGQLRPV